MSVRLTALTTPSNNSWEDIVVVADGSNTVGYSITNEHWDFCDQIREAVEEISGLDIETLSKAYNHVAVIARTFYLEGVGNSKRSFKADMDKEVIHRVFDKAYQVVKGNTGIRRMDLSYLKGDAFWKIMKS